MAHNRVMPAGVLCVHVRKSHTWLHWICDANDGRMDVNRRPTNDPDRARRRSVYQGGRCVWLTTTWMHFPQSGAMLIGCDSKRGRIAANIAKLPELLSRHKT